MERLQLSHENLLITTKIKINNLIYKSNFKNIYYYIQISIIYLKTIIIYIEKCDFGKRG